MNELGFPLETLMELAGMSVAHSIYHLNKEYEQGNIKNILIIVGPGSKLNTCVINNSLKIMVEMV